MIRDVLPVNNTTLWEGTMADVLDEWATLSPPIVRFRSAKLLNPEPSFVPWLIYEYGLGELTPYVPNLYQLINEGLRWQRVRGTHAAVHKGLGWVGVTGEIEEARSIRNFWNSFQLHLDALPVNDFPQLERIENIATLSVPVRSKLRRGTFNYNVKTMELDGGRLDQRRLDGDSGIRIRPDGTIWSFRRTTLIEHVLTEAEGTAIGNWLPTTEDEGQTWEDTPVAWEDLDVAWNATPVIIRQTVLAGWFAGKLIYQVFRDAEGDVIGYRRARATYPVRQQFGGRYQFGATPYEPRGNGTRVYIEAMTDFNDADGVTATETALIIGGTLAVGVPVGRLWLGPGQLIGGDEIAVTAVNLPMRKTVREQAKTLLRF